MSKATGSKVLAFTNLKGGCGKSTLAIHLSISLSKKKKRICTLDLDPQGSTEAFLIDYEGTVPTLSNKHIPSSAMGSVPKLVNALKTENQYIVLDVGGGDLVNIQNVLGYADWLILPARPSKKDIASTSALIASLARRGDFTANPQINAVIILNQCSYHPMSTTADEAAEALNSVIAQCGLTDRIKILDSRLHIATAWIEADMECKTVDEIGKNKAAGQWAKVVAELTKKGVI
jgi:chromosome partitioning protein